MRREAPIIALALVAWASAAPAQQVQPKPPDLPAQVVCPPDVKGNPPTVGGPSSNLSEQLSDSKGVICPPAGVDSEIGVRPPAGGELRVIPPPGSPGGNPNVQPKYPGSPGAPPVSRTSQGSMKGGADAIRAQRRTEPPWPAA